MNLFSSVRDCALVGLLTLGWGISHAHAATLTVQSTADTDGSSCGATCTLRQALNAANATSDPDTIVFAPSLFGSSRRTITLSASLPEIAAPLTLTGPSTPGAGITLDAGGKSSILSVSSGTSLTLSRLTLTGGKARAGSAISNFGEVTMRNCTLSNNSSGDPSSLSYAFGAFYNGGTATISNCTFSNNTVIARNDPAGGGACGGGAIANVGTTLTVSNCTFFNCSAQVSGAGHVTCSGGALFSRAGTVTVSSCTFTGNTSRGGGGGAIDNRGRSTLKLSNSLVVGNSPLDIANGSAPFGSVGIFISEGHNLVGSASGARFGASDQMEVTSEQVKVGTLADNGGPTQTLALLPGSIAIDAGQTALTGDQRGFSRPQGSAPDIGAFELDGRPLPAISIDSPSIKEGSSGRTALTFTLTLSQASSREVSVLVNTLQDTAKAGSDYQSVGRGTVTFAPGTTKQAFTVRVVGDTLVEGDEQFRLALRSPVNATLGTATGIGTILNDDSAPKSPSSADSSSSS